MKEPHILILLGVVAGIIGSGTVFFHLVEGWSWVDAYFFSVVTLSTVGYGTPIPETDLGKIGTTVYILTGIGLFAWVLNSFANKMLRHGPLTRPHPHDRTKEEGDG